MKEITGANQADTDFRRALLGLTDAPLDPRALIGRRVRFERGLIAPQSIVFGVVMGVTYRLAHYVNGIDLAQQDRHAVLDVLEDGGAHSDVPFGRVEFVEPDFSEQAKGGPNEKSSQDRSE